MCINNIWTYFMLGLQFTITYLALVLIFSPKSADSVKVKRFSTFNQAIGTNANRGLSANTGHKVVIASRKYLEGIFLRKLMNTNENKELDSILLLPDLWKSVVDAGWHTAKYNVSDGCTGALTNYATALSKQEGWALRVLDASGRRSSGLLMGAMTQYGSYDECLNVHHYRPLEPQKANPLQRAQFCSVFLQLPAPILDLIQQLDVPYPVKLSRLTVDLCVPELCSREDVFRIVSKYIQDGNFSVKIDSVNCYYQQDIADDTAAVVAIAIIVLILMLGLIGTSLDVHHHCKSVESLAGEVTHIGLQEKQPRLARFRSSLLQRLNSTGSLAGVSRLRRATISGYKPSFIRRVSDSIIRHRPPVDDAVEPEKNSVVAEGHHDQNCGSDSLNRTKLTGSSGQWIALDQELTDVRLVRSNPLNQPDSNKPPEPQTDIFKSPEQPVTNGHLQSVLLVHGLSRSQLHQPTTDGTLSCSDKENTSTNTETENITYQKTATSNENDLLANNILILNGPPENEVIFTEDHQNHASLNCSRDQSLNNEQFPSVNCQLDQRKSLSNLTDGVQEMTDNLQVASEDLRSNDHYETAENVIVVSSDSCHIKNNSGNISSSDKDSSSVLCAHPVSESLKSVLDEEAENSEYDRRLSSSTVSSENTECVKRSSLSRTKHRQSPKRISFMLDVQFISETHHQASSTNKQNQIPSSKSSKRKQSTPENELAAERVLSYSNSAFSCTEASSSPTVYSRCNSIPDADADEEVGESYNDVRKNSSQNTVSDNKEAISGKHGSEKNGNDAACHRKDNLLAEVILCFSLLRNVRKIMSEGNADHMFCLNGIRVLSISWIVLGNTLSLMNGTPSRITNNVDTAKMGESFWMQAIVNSTFAADSFFVLSGCLVAYNFFRSKSKELSEKMIPRNLCKSIFPFYFHRLMRIVPCYYITIMIYTVLLPYLGSNKGSENVAEEGVKLCQNHWWANVFFFSNFYKADQMCMTWTYYLVNDVQFYIISPLILYPMLVIPRLGWSLLLSLVALQIICTGILNKASNGNNLRMDAEFFSQVYVKPYCRIAAFAVGIGVGALIYNKGRRIYFRRLPLLLGWAAASSVLGIAVYITYTENQCGGHEWTSLEIALYEAFSRPGWSLALAWLIFTCYVGQGGYVNNILSWNAFLPLCRITYGVYLLHPVLIEAIFNSSNYPYYMHFGSLIYQFVPNLVCSYGLAFFLIILVECPFTSLDQIIHKRLAF